MNAQPKLIGVTMRVDEARERRDALDQAWYKVLDRANLRAVLLPNFPGVAGGVDALVRDLGLGGILLTGGNDIEGSPDAQNIAPERDSFELELLNVCAERELPLLGVCRGFQMMVLHFGGSLSAVHEHVATQHCLRAVPDNRLGLTDRAQINSYHGFGVRPEDVGGLQIAGFAQDGSVEAVCHANHRQAAIMWHPERGPLDELDQSLLSRWFQNSPRAPEKNN